MNWFNILHPSGFKLNCSRRRCLILVVLLLPISFSKATAQDPAASASLSGLKPKIDSIIQPLVEKQKIVGAAVGVIRDNERLVTGYGLTKLESGRIPDGDTVYEIGSITKVFTATVLADMIEKQEVAITDRVQSFLPESVHIPSKDGIEITLGDLTTQVSGLVRMPGNFSPADPENPYADYTVDKMYEFLAKSKLRSKPGETYLYSNLGVGLLGHALSLKAGMSYEELVTQRILAPLGMKDTRITLTPEMQSRLALPYAKYGKMTKNWDIPTFAGAGALRSTVNDMLKFAAANLEVAPSDLASAMRLAHTERFKVNDDLSVAMGWHISRVKDLDEAVVWHNGETGGYHSFLGLLLKRKAAAVILCNTQSSVDEAAIEALKILAQ